MLDKLEKILDNEQARKYEMFGAGAGVGAAIVWALLNRERIANRIRGVARPPMDLTEAEALARANMAQRGIVKVDPIGSDFDGRYWVVQLKETPTGTIHCIRINARSRKIEAWTQKPGS